MSALATMLHSFYTGVENIFKRAAIEIDGGPPTTENWHRDLLDSMATSTAWRSAVVSADTQRRLLGYLSFRHVFRHAYTFRLRWDKMAVLVLECEGVFRQLEADLNSFLRAGNGAAWEASQWELLRPAAE